MCSLLRSFPSRLLVPSGRGYARSLIETPLKISSCNSHTSTEQIPNFIFNKVNNIISSGNVGQTFAVIHLHDEQYLIHVGDMISSRVAISADIGDKIKLEKCLLFGNENFTLVGRPLLNRDLVHVEATVIEKSMTQTYFNMFAIQRNHGFRRYQFKRVPLSVLRINEISVCHPLNTTQDRIN